MGLRLQRYVRGAARVVKTVLMGCAVADGASIAFSNEVDSIDSGTWSTSLSSGSDSATGSFALPTHPMDQAIMAIELYDVSWDFGELTFEDVVIVRWEPCLVVLRVSSYDWTGCEHYLGFLVHGRRYELQQRCRHIQEHAHRDDQWLRDYVLHWKHRFRVAGMRTDGLQLTREPVVLLGRPDVPTYSSVE